MVDSDVTSTAFVLPSARMRSIAEHAVLVEVTWRAAAPAAETTKLSFRTVPAAAPARKVGRANPGESFGEPIANGC